MSSLETAIIKTVAYFDIFDYPLTAFEIWQYLGEASDLYSIQQALENNTLPLEKKWGFFFLQGRESIVTTRQERYKITDQKIKTLKKRLRLIQWLPGIRLICLANSIGSHNLRATSDNDLFIITNRGYVWLVKFWATSILKLLGFRPTIEHSADRLCLSFLVDESNLDLSTCRNPADPYFTYWLAGLVPLYGDITAYQQLLKANSWLPRELPNWSIEATSVPCRFSTRPSRIKKNTAIQKRLEEYSKRFQKTIMPQQLKAKANQTTDVIITDSMLKLHTADRRTYFQIQYHERLSALNLL